MRKAVSLLIPSLVLCWAVWGSAPSLWAGGLFDEEPMMESPDGLSGSDVHPSADPISMPEPVADPALMPPAADRPRDDFSPGPRAASAPNSHLDPKEQIFQQRFAWWPTDAKPAPVKDIDRGGYWWWPTDPGQVRPWGNRGYIYVRKIIFDYKEVPTVSQDQLKPSLVVKKIHYNVKIYFNFDEAAVREDAVPVLDKAVDILRKHPETDILITGHADVRGSEDYNLKLGERRGEAVKEYILSKDVEIGRVRIVSRGKLDAVAPVTDLVGMQRDRNAQFMVAEVVEVMIPESQRYLYEGAGEDRATGMEIARPADSAPAGIDELEVRELTGEVRVGFKEYTVQKGDTLGELAKEVYGSASRWTYIYNFNRDVIGDPHRLRVGQVIRIPDE